MARLPHAHLPARLDFHYVLSLLFSSCCICTIELHVASGAAVTPASNLLPLPPDFNFSLGLAAAEGSLSVISTTVPDNGFFVPLLISPSFNTTDDARTQGFSLGFLFLTPQSDLFNTSIYLAVCAGRSGNYSSDFSDGTLFRDYVDGMHNESVYGMSLGGLVVPMYIMNYNRRLISVHSTLSVMPIKNTSSRELQLKDSDGSVVWRVADVGNMMEMQDSGELLIYDSSNASAPVWRSSEELVTDTLFQWQMMKPGMALHSNNSAYMARMEKGGLVLYMMGRHFITDQPPYWIMPVPFPGDKENRFPNLNMLLSSSPCSEGQDVAYSRLGNSSWSLYLHGGGSCFNNSEDIQFYSISLSPNYTQFQIETSNNMSLGPLDTWSFLKLEDDGRIYLYVVTHSPSSNSDMPSVESLALDKDGGIFGTSQIFGVPAKYEVPAFTWGDCDLPARCGPLGLCTPDIENNVCTCPPSFDPLNATDPSRGCTRKLDSKLPPCSEKGTEHVNTTQYVPVLNTSTIFLFSGWEFNASATSASVQTCKSLCSSNCSCNGFFYQANVSACFFMTDEVSLLNLDSDSYSLNGGPAYASFLTPEKKAYMNAYFGFDSIGRSSHTAYVKVGLGSTNSSSSSSNTTSHTYHVTGTTIIIFTVIGSVLLIGVLAYCIQRARHIKHDRQAMARVEEELRNALPLLPRRFTYKELVEATNKFDTLLGAGGCGSVYGGTLQDKTQVAVKVLKLSLTGEQTKQFLTELATIGSTSHQNIVHLVGFCWDHALHRLLVYEYVEGGSLDRWLFKKDAHATTGRRNEENKSSFIESKETMTASPPPDMFQEWSTRYNVALGIARGLSYLQEECPQPILHFDIKPQNILLDNKFAPKLADFGLSRFIQRDVSKVETGMRGTPGYIAPEWLSQGTVGKKSDVYSMGMVFLEILGGRRNIDLKMLKITQNHIIPGDGGEGAANSSTEAEDASAWHFPSWAAAKCEDGLMMEMLDKSVRNANEEEMRRLAYTAFWCILDDPKMRPSAAMVVQWLEASSEVKRPPLSSIRTISCNEDSESFVRTVTNGGVSKRVLDVGLQGMDGEESRLLDLN